MNLKGGIIANSTEMLIMVLGICFAVMLSMASVNYVVGTNTKEWIKDNGSDHLKKLYRQGTFPEKMYYLERANYFISEFDVGLIYSSEIKDFSAKDEPSSEAVNISNIIVDKYHISSNNVKIIDIDCKNETVYTLENKIVKKSNIITEAVIIDKEMPGTPITVDYNILILLR